MMTDDDAREDMAHELAIDYELQRRKRMDSDCGYYAEDEKMDSLIENNENKTNELPSQAYITIEKAKNGFIISDDDGNAWIASSEYAVGDIVREIAGRL